MIELSPTDITQKEINKIKEREFEKFKKTKDEKYLLSSKLIELFQNRHNDPKLIPLVYKLLKLNDGKYNYISTICNFNLALKFENNSPRLAMQFIDIAIKSDRKYFLPHLYHAKGRFYYTEGKYSNALFYFRKSLKVTDPNDKLYIASMYNNFALVDDKLNHIESALKNVQKGIKILESKDVLDKVELNFLNVLKSNLGMYFYKLKDYRSAEKILLQEVEFYKSNEDFYANKSQIYQKLFDIYSITNQNENQKKLVEYLISIAPNLKTISDKISAYEIIQKYYINTGNNLQTKVNTERLNQLSHLFLEENKNNLKEISGLLNNEMIKSIDEKYNYEIKIEKRKNLFIITATLLFISIFIIIAISIRNKIKEEKILAEKQKQILENNEKILEQNLKIQQEKIKSLHQNLNLKIETEKAFLENLRKIKRLKNIDSEQMLRDLFLKVTNLMNIDKKNHHLINESSIENNQFLIRLKDLYPSLTNKELKLCTYFRMDLSSKEISSLENTTMGTVRVYKTKIKTKLELDKESDLLDFLKNI
ncbi:LuxR C-terminal-related transcriptional regulator [Chryseobacterium sp.]|uniref:tetratricopeptide repeat protein n=1 Tax=Chryseobacterium sp. TaxID=1871047 RepID=UPI002848F9E2|nr:LuxR C-terminal-related transcriptional regulator [Chryseobacterium sp.]MDR3023084.1 LuxR C-terminal-related transcriptional regulator [Chryseobacterium sp.]